MAEAGEGPEVALEATYGYYWAADLLKDNGANVHRAVRGQTVTRKISEEQQRRYQAWFDNARRLRELVSELEALSLQAFEQAEGSSRRS